MSKKIEIVLDEIPGRTALVAEEGTEYYQNRKLAEDENEDVTIVTVKVKSQKTIDD